MKIKAKLHYLRDLILIRFLKGDRRLYRVVNVIYYKVYLKSEPSADYYYLKLTAEKDDYNRPIISFNDYVIDEQLFNTAMYSIMYKYKLSPIDIYRVKNAVLLGASPVFKNYNYRHDKRRNKKFST